MPLSIVKYFNMNQRFTVRKFLPVIVVYAALLYCELAVAFDYHDLSDPPLRPCPVCAASHVLSFADNSPQYLYVKPKLCVFDFLPPDMECFFQHSVFLSHLNYRAPPHN